MNAKEREKLRELVGEWRCRSRDAKICALDYDETLRCADELDAILAEQPVGEKWVPSGLRVQAMFTAPPAPIAEPAQMWNTVTTWDEPAPTADKAGVDDAAVNAFKTWVSDPANHGQTTPETEHRFAFLAGYRAALDAAAPQAPAQAVDGVDEALAQLVYKYIDRMNDVDPAVDPAERILAEFARDANSAMAAAAPQKDVLVERDEQGLISSVSVGGRVIAGNPEYVRRQAPVGGAVYTTPHASAAMPMDEGYEAATPQQPPPVGVTDGPAALIALWRQSEPDNGEDETEFDKGCEQTFNECADALERWWLSHQQPAPSVSEDDHGRS